MGESHPRYNRCSRAPAIMNKRYVAGCSFMVILAIVLNDMRDAALPCPRPDAADPSTNPQCFFAQSYFQARALFLDKASAAGAQLHRIPLNESNPTLRGLSIDVAVLKGDPKKLVLHIAGTHGTEGFVGSAIQSAWLQSYQNNS